MRNTFLLLLSILSLSCSSGKQTYIDGAQVEDMRYHSKRWEIKDDHITIDGIDNFYISNFLLTKGQYRGDSFSAEAIISIDSLHASHSAFCFFGNKLLFSAAAPNSKEPIISIENFTWSGTIASDSLAVTSSHIKAGEKFKINLASRDSLIEIRVNDKMIGTCRIEPDRVGELGFATGKDAIDIYSFSVVGKPDKSEGLPFLFERFTDGYSSYRIPTLITTPKGRLLAIAEGRVGSTSDTGAIHLVLKRSNDNGRTWSKLEVINDEEGFTNGNPVPVVDEMTGKIFILMTRNLSEDHEWQIINSVSKDTRRVFIIESSDDGESWSKPREITEDVKKDSWTWYATGPCHGIQIKNGKYRGRLVVPCDHIEQDSKKYYSHAIYSDDGGATWRLGGRTPSDMVNECSVAEREDGSLILNMRNYDTRERNRKTSLSYDGGESWSFLESDKALIEPICQGALHRYSFSEEGRSRLLFSNPAHSTNRENMTIRISYDDGATWPVSKVLHSGPTAYSDIIRLGDDNVGVLYEAGYLYPYEGVVFESLPLSKLEQ